MSNAMKGVTKALITMNKKMDLPGLNKVSSQNPSIGYTWNSTSNSNCTLFVGDEGVHERE